MYRSFEQQKLVGLPSENSSNVSSGKDATGQNYSLTEIVANVITAIQPMIMEAVASAISATTETIMQEIKQNLHKARSVEDDVTSLKHEVCKNKSSNDKLEQYSRKENIKIFGLKENPNEDLEMKVIDLSKDIGVDIVADDISVCHRLPGGGKYPRPAIVKFVRRKTKVSIMKAKKNLKELPQRKDVFITDDLTRLRSKIVRYMKDDEKISKVWTIEGKIHCVMSVDGKDQKIKIDDLDDVQKLGWDEGKLEDLGLFLAL